jgi:diaminopimelate decarboxylase
MEALEDLPVAANENAWPEPLERDAHGIARIDGVELDALARAVGTPCYLYSARAIRQRIAAMQSAFAGRDALICYAVKANPSLGVLQQMAQAGLGADIVSGGELRRALRAGIAPAKIVFSGVGKTAAEIDDALSLGIWKFNLESEDELGTLQGLAALRHLHAHAAIRINPDVDAGTHDKISTGRAGDKFGVDLDTARRWYAQREHWPNVRIDGLHMHIGSQVTQLEPFRAALARIVALQRELEAGGHRIDSIDVGGGLGARYRAGHDHPLPIAQYAEAIREALGDYAGRLVLEPGRHLVAESGVLLTRVVRTKPGAPRDFLVLDAAMNDLARPSLYGAWHEIVPLHALPRATQRYDVVGPVCESSDRFAHDRPMPRCRAGDLVAIAGAGAYGASMSSTYNSRPLVSEVMIDAGRYAVIRRRQTLDQLLAGEVAAPAWTTPE